MNSREYIHNKINELVRRFPNIKIVYQFDEISDIHIIEVLPKDFFENNEEYKQYESEISFEFDNKFLPESVLFVSENSLNQVEIPELELVGKNYYEFEPELFYEFDNKYIEYFSPISDEIQNIIEVLGLGIESEIFNLVSAGIYINDSISSYEEMYSTAPEVNYALAA